MIRTDRDPFHDLKAFTEMLKMVQHPERRSMYNYKDQTKTANTCLQSAHACSKLVSASQQLSASIMAILKMWKARQRVRQLAQSNYIKEESHVRGKKLQHTKLLAFYSHLKYQHQKQLKIVVIILLYNNSEQKPIRLSLK